MNRSSKLTILSSLFLLWSCSSSRTLFKEGQLHQTQSRESLQFDQVLSTTQSNNLIFVSVEIADKEYRFLFDTGAPMVISKELQEEFQFKIRTQKQVYDSQNQSQVQNYVTVDSLIIGELLFTDLTAIEADLRYSPILACLNIDGIIGANLMRYAFWEMDAATGYLRMSSSTKHWPLDTSNLISKTFKVKNTYTPVMDLRLGNTLYRNITFDTGSNDLLSLGKTGNANYHADSVLFKAYGILSAGLFGSVVDTVEYQFLDFYLDSLPYRCPIEFESAKDARLLGMSFFSQFRIYMDWTAGKMHFLPHDSLNFSNSKSYPTSPFLKDNAIIISQLNDFTLRDQLNLALGDTIESINGKSIYPATAETYCEVIELFKREEQLTLQIRRKGEMLIRKEDLFTTMNLR